MRNLLSTSLLLFAISFIGCSGGDKSEESKDCSGCTTEQSVVSGCESCDGCSSTEECSGGEESKSIESITFSNADFYGADGEFLVEKGKDAVLALMKYHNAPIYPDTRKNLWVSDYGTGEYIKLGLACVCYINNVDDRYMQMDLYLLPGQMLPEHWHLDPADKTPAKREGWLVRWGKSYITGVGVDNMSSYSDIVVPTCHMDGEVETKHVVEANAGEFVPLAKVYTKHWQFAGREGAIITEVANCHNDKAVRHNDKKINDNFLGL